MQHFIGVRVKSSTKSSTVLAPVHKPDAICVNVFGDSITVLTNATPFPQPSQSFLTNGLVAYYPFNGNANDASGNGNGGTVQGATLTPDRFGAPNSAYYFDGVSGGIKIPDTLLSPTVGGFTFSVWVDTDNGPYTGEYAIIHTGTDYGETVLHISSGQYLFGPILEPDVDYFVTSPASSNSVTHVVGVYSRGQNVSLYTNWVLATIIPVPDSTLWLEPTYPLYSGIGIYEIYAPSPYYNFRGVLDDIRIYNRALSSNEVTQLFAYESGPNTNPPSITGQPQSVTVNAGDNVSFTVTATGTLPLQYQWSLNGTNILGATASSLTISNVAQTDLGAYAVVLSNPFGATNSSNATLSMYPFIETPFIGAITYWGTDAKLGIEGWGTGPLHYQWFKDGIALLNATNQTLFLPSIQFTNAGLYSVVLISSLGSVTNKPAQVVVNPAGVSIGMYGGCQVWSRHLGENTLSGRTIYRLQIFSAETCQIYF
jgi:Concanavalin A-like lectin/glucanases superfamily/Immunoglobulin domain